MAVIKSYQGQFNCPNQFVKSTLYDILMDEPVGTVATVIYENVADAIRAYQNINDDNACQEEAFTRVEATTKDIESENNDILDCVTSRIFYHIKDEPNTMIEAILIADESDERRVVRFRRINPVSAVNALSLNDIFTNELANDPIGFRVFKSYRARASDLIKFLSEHSKR